ncbi:uncharacterized protein [Antedon mediterranea]|uniref:uncharacterized protein n=1 Tax=Antedon mediterranea TaxID=105859 RepID=UPI003AF98C00
MRFILILSLLIGAQAISWSTFKKKAAKVLDEVIDRAEVILQDEDITEEEDISMPRTTPLPFDMTLEDEAEKWNELGQGILQCQKMESLETRFRRETGGSGLSEMILGLVEWISDMSADIENYEPMSFEKSIDKSERSFARSSSNFDLDMFDLDEVVAAPSRDRSEEKTKPTDKYESPDYSVMCSTEDYEVRRYNASVWMSTSVIDFSRQTAGSRAFRRLYQYITGANREGVQIPMTIPVITRTEATCSPFKLFKNYTYSFYLPVEFWDNTPTPTNEKVFMERFPATTFYVSTFCGYMNSFKVAYQLYKLKNALDASNKSYVDNFYLTAGYNKPTQFFDRTNEIWIPFDGARDNPCLDLKPTIANPHVEECEGLNCPKYQLLETLDEGVELRRYSNLNTVIKKAYSCDFETARSDSYDPVSWYFRGFNSKQQNIKPVGPVLFTIDRPQELPENCDAVYQTAFIAPSNLKGNLPESFNNSVNREFIDSLDVYVYQFKGSMTNTSVVNYERLRAILGSRCYEENSFILAEYSLNRTIEVWIEAASGCQVRTEAPPAMATSRNQPPSFTIPPVVLNIQPQIITGQNRMQTALPSCTAGIDCPSYQLVTKHGNVEERTYEPSKWVCSYSKACNIDMASNDNYQRLSLYMAGTGNREGTVISMTSPSILKMSVADLDKISCKKNYEMCLYLPDDITPPSPKETNVYLKKDQGRVVYTYPLEKSIVGKRFRKMAKNAILEVDRLGLETKDYLYLSQYRQTGGGKYMEIWLPKITQ